MTENIVRIEDTHAHVFYITVWTPSTATNLKFWNCNRTRYQIGDWETLDKGFINVNNGDGFLVDRKSPEIPGYCFSVRSVSDVDFMMGKPGANDAAAYSLFQWGMALHGYVDSYGRVQQSGKGQVKQTWVLGLEPGTIWWRMATMADMFSRGTQQIQPAAAPSAPQTDAGR